jgi:large subunit ribosomal protein L1
MKRSRRYRELADSYDQSQALGVKDAVVQVKKLATAKYDESIDAALRLGIDPRHADQMVRGTVVLPHGTGKTVRVAVFAKGDHAKEAQEAGADVVGADDLVAKVQEGWLEFDRVVATPEMMGLVGRLGRVLGPRGLMPNPKLGTVTFEVGKAVRDIKGGKVDFRAEKTGIVHSTVGRASMSAEQLQENVSALLERVFKLKPSAAKGRYLRSMALSPTMGPGVRVDCQEVTQQFT